MVDTDGNKTGVPIKASDFYSKPTLSYLQLKFTDNETSRQAHKARIKNTIDLAFLKRSNTILPDLIKALEKESISTVIRQNKTGLVYGITYIDHRSLHFNCLL